MGELMILVDLLDPLEVKGIRLKNRIVMPPMATGLATNRGAVTDSLIEHYVRRSKALGLLIVEHSYVLQGGKLSERQLGIYDNSLVSGLRKLTDSIHAMGTPIVIQINHAGMLGIEPVAPSPSEGVRELQEQEIRVLVDAFAAAAERAIMAGFDGVDIHGAHGFLLCQFLSPLTNKRRDKYGGSLENRMRLPLEIVGEVRKRVGEKIVLYRLGSVDLDPAGTKIKDSQMFAKKLQKAGIDIIDVSGGMCGSRPAKFQDIQGYFVPQAQQIKNVVDIPVIGVGGIRDPEYANRFLHKGQVDLVAVGRSLLKDPDWATKAIRILEESAT